jgi:hypothetical protein
LKSVDLPTFGRPTIATKFAINIGLFPPHNSVLTLLKDYEKAPDVVRHPMNICRG